MVLPPPKVSIGMPVFNSKSTVSAAIDSILKQSFGDFELIISDNASSDGTSEICSHYALQDNRIKYVCQNYNIGAWPNFDYVLKQSRGEYFMWAAGDDVRTDRFLEKGVSILNNRPDVVCVSSDNRWRNGDASGAIQSFELSGNLFERYRGFMQHCFDAHACFYSLMRRQSLSDCNDMIADHLAVDWSVITHLLSKGKFVRVVDEMLILGRHGTSNQSNFLQSFQSRSIHILIPWYEFSRKFIARIARSKELSESEKVTLYFVLAKFNLVRLIKRISE